MWLSPLAMLSSMIASRSFFAGSLVSLAIILLTLFFGRVWCGWLCPLGTLLDIFSFRKWLKKTTSLPDWMRSLKYGVLLAILFAALFGDQSLIFLDPITLAYRAVSGAVLPVLDRVITAVEMLLYRVDFLRGGVNAVDDLIRPAIIPAEPVFSSGAIWFAAAFLGLILLNLFAERFWCRYLCPLGGLLGLLSRIGLIKRAVNERCTSCGACARVCPTETISPDKGYASDPSECTMCMDCLRSCPANAIEFKPLLKPAQRQEYDPKRRVVLASLGAGITLAALPRVLPQQTRQSTYLLRPPGAGEEHLLSACVRCGACTRVCPTGGLQPALGEISMNGWLTPVLVPRVGYCDYACNACGQVCPTHAIPLLELAVKQQQRIGQAYIDENRCIPWADGISCAVCEEMCPVTPQKAITLSSGGSGGSGHGGGSASAVPRPHVDRSKCIGCGICETRCPVSGEAAIRVRVRSF